MSVIKVWNGTSWEYPGPPGTTVGSLPVKAKLDSTDYLLGVDNASGLAVRTPLNENRQPIEPVYSGAMYAMNAPQGGGNTGGVANIFHGVKVWLSAGRLDRIGIWHVSATAAETFRPGIFNVDANLEPSSLLLDPGTTDLSTAAGVKMITINQVISSPGFYILGGAKVGGTTAQVRYVYSGGAGAGESQAGGESFGLVRYRSMAGQSAGGKYSFSVAGALPASPTWALENPGAYYPGIYMIFLRYA